MSIRSTKNQISKVSNPLPSVTLQQQIFDDSIPVVYFHYPAYVSEVRADCCQDQGIDLDFTNFR